MVNHGYAYVSGIPTEAERANVNGAEVQRFYTRILPNAVEGAHPALVFNMDEMGAERYADRKRINVFVPRKKPLKTVAFLLASSARPTDARSWRVLGLTGRG